MKKHGTKMLSALLIVVLMLSMSTAVLAAGPNYEQQNTKQDKGAALTLLFAMYAPESLSEYLSTQQEHEQFHAGRKDAHDELKQDAGVQFTDIIDAYKNGEMSAEDAINAIIERKDNLEDFKEELSKIVD